MRHVILPRTVNFADCDSAQIVFYPRYFEWFDRGTEMLFRSVGLPWEEMFGKDDWKGVPLLDASASFKRPCRLGDSIEVESTIAEWRGKTFVVRHQIRNKGEMAVEGRELRIWTVADKSRPGGLRGEPVPAEIMARFQS